MVPGTPQRGGPDLVTLHEISIARYLQRSQIVQSTSDYRLNVQSNDWWDEPPSAMLNRVLVEELSQRLPGTEVLAELGAVSADASAVVQLNILRMEAGPNNMLNLEAQIAVGDKRDGRPFLRKVANLTVPIAGSDTRSTVAAISLAVGQLADIIASMLHSV